MRASTLQKRTRIIEVATELFIEQGYKDTSLDQIVSICGGSKQTLYRYFSNKEGLFMEVLEHNTKNSLESVFRLDIQHNETLETTLDTFALKYLKGICGNPLLGLCRIISADFNKHPYVGERFWQTGPVRIRKYLIDFLKNHQACQTLYIEDADLACDHLLALIKLDYQNIALMGLALPDDEQLNQHAQQAVRTFLKIYQK